MLRIFEDYKEKYFGKDLPSEHHIFNVTHLIMGIVSVVFLFLIYFFMDSEQAFGIAFCAATFSMFTLYEANRTNHFVACGVAMSVMLNLVFFPIIFFTYNRSACIIPIYFLFGLLYNNLVLPKTWSIFLSAVDMVADIILLYAANHGLTKMKKGLLMDFRDLCTLIIAFVFVVTVSGIVILYKKHILKVEKSTYRKIHEDVLNASNMQDIFLVNMSHEIRTPMNAIIGNTELLLDREINEAARNNLYGIYNSGTALLSLINEIMDISKSSRQEVVIYNSRYDIREFLAEIIDMVTVRLSESDIEFSINIHKDIPRYLYSDTAKLRQLFINIINYALKSAEHKSLTLEISCLYKRNSEIDLIFSVYESKNTASDAALSEIKSDPYYNDPRSRNQNLKEFTDMSLNICKEILDCMDGSITMGNGDETGVFILARLPQKVESEEKIISVEENNKYNVLIYEKDDYSTKNLEELLTELSIPSLSVRDNETFLQEYKEDRYSHVFIANENYMEIKELLAEDADKELAVISTLSDSLKLNEKGLVLMRPLQLLNLTNILKGTSGVYLNYSRSRENTIRIPDVNILVVDDNITNLMVAKNLLEKYKATVNTALSGREALELIQKEDYDLIFLDYMMPDMDGVDTLHAIRILPDLKYREIPVIALTANVVNGAREMFFDKGFDDYIAKPINISKLEKSLKILLPKEKIQIVDASDE
ncbi:MAG: response regulator [Lachnospiraceae bacterium]|nr:response regulator [Lachnospiraceae bacterium]